MFRASNHADRVSHWFVDINKVNFTAWNHDASADKVIELEYCVEQSMFRTGQIAVNMRLAQQRADFFLRCKGPLVRRPTSANQSQQPSRRCVEADHQRVKSAGKRP